MVLFSKNPDTLTKTSKFQEVEAMERKSEVFLNLINAFIYQVEAGEAYAQTPDVPLDDIEYIGFTLILGAGDSGTYNCHAYGYEADGISHIMVLNSSKLFGFIKEYAALTPSDDFSTWKTCILGIPEDTHQATAEFLYGRDAEPWQLPALSIAEFVRPGKHQEKDAEWNKEVYSARYGRDRTEALPPKRYTGGFENIVDLPPSVIVELDEELGTAIEELFNHSNDEPANPAPMVFGLTSTPEFIHPIENHESFLPNTLEESHGESGVQTLVMEREAAPENNASKTPGNGLFSKSNHDSKFKWNLGRRKGEPEVSQNVSESTPETPNPPVREPENIAKDQILPSLLKYSLNELSNKKIDASMASIIIYLQPPVITSYGFWYSENSQGHWMPESYELDDAMDALLRDSIPDPKHPWDACVVRMDFDTWEVTTEFLTGKNAYAWMEPMSHRSKSLSQIAKYKKEG